MAAVENQKRPKIVVLDGYTLNPGDLSWNRVKALGPTIVYEHSKAEAVVERSKEAGILLVNKVKLTKAIIGQLPQLKCICVTATGYNNVDLEASRARNIPVCNAVGYSTPSVAQHVFALLLELTNRVGDHNKSVQEGEWSAYRDFSYTLQSIPELEGSTLGIYGFGRIGQKVAEIAQAFGMNILATHKHPERDARPGVEFVPLMQLFEKSDVLTLHAPLSDENRGTVNKELLTRMKPHAILINTGRGGLINEADLKIVLMEKKIFGAALDVLSSEPPPENHPLMGLDNCLITPHLAWASRPARERLMEITVHNIKAFLKGEPQNRVN